MSYTVSTFRKAGLDARWTRTRAGAPIISVRTTTGWYVVDRAMWHACQKEGVRQAVDRFTMLGAFFSVSA